LVEVGKARWDAGALDRIGRADFLCRTLGVTALALLVSYLVTTPVIGAFNLAQFIVLGTLCVVSVLAWLSRDTARFQVCAYGFVVTSMTASFLFTLVTGGLHGIAAPLLIVSPLIGLLLGARHAFVMAIITILMIVALIPLGQLGLTRSVELEDWCLDLYAAAVMAAALFIVLFSMMRFVRLADHALWEAERAEQANSDLLADMSHEIRTPMNGVLGLLEVALHADNLESQRRRIDRAYSAARSLVRILDDVLDLSKLNNADVHLDVMSVDVRAFAEETMELFETRAEQKGLSLGLKVDASVPTHVKTDPTRLRQILSNLLGNAIKFTHEGTVEVQIAWAAERHALRIEVKDSGIGMSEEECQRLFSRYSQANAQTNRRYGGTGLGLFISSRIVDAFGGEIGVESKPGTGSCFWVILPGHEPGEAGQVEISEALSEPVRSLRVLAVDDVQVNRTVVGALLGHLGHVVTIEDNAESALELLSVGEHFDLVLMDIQMPGMDGLEAMARIRALPGRAGRVRIVALTGNVMPEQINSYREAGFDACLTKPIQLAQLQSCLDEVASTDHPD